MKNRINNLIHLMILICLCVHASAYADYFTNISKQSGVVFEHNNGNSNQFYYPEIVGSGVALFDYDNDGDLDIYLVQSGDFKNNQSTDKLYTNSVSNTKELNFKEIKFNFLKKTNEYGIGVATADVNHDGWVDFYLTNLNQNQLYINNQGKGFSQLKINESLHLWSSSASFCDINNDGYKDLYVSNYVDWSESNNPKCYNGSSKRDYCGPGSFNGAKDSFYINDTGKSFRESTQKYFPKMPNMAGLNVVCNDVNNDGYNDFIVANDGQANLVWINQKGQSFKESGLFSGLAVNAQGVAEASMGLALSDYDLDGDLDVFFTHLMNESNTLYRNNGKGYFSDVTNRSKLSAESFAFTGWATGFLMVNNDIYPDLVVFNGAVADASQKQSEEPSLEQANQLFLNAKSGQFTHVEGEQWLLEKNISRGAAFGDIDNDGDTDIVVNNNNGNPDILINNLNPEKWMGIKIHDDLYRNLTLEIYNDELKMKLNNTTDGAYASAHDDRIVLNQAQLEQFSKMRISHQKKVLLELPLKQNNQYKTIQLK